MTAALKSVADLRVAHLIECDGPGGAERVVAHLATTLQAAGAFNVVFVPADGEGWLAGQLAGSGVAIEQFRVDRPVSASLARDLERKLWIHRVTVAHSHEFTMAVYGAWASRRAGIPHVITMHGSRYYAGRLQRRLATRAAIAASHSTVAVSDALARAMRSDLWLGRSAVTVVPNGVHYEAPAQLTLREELGLKPKDQLAVAVGNLYSVKGHRHLIEAVALLSERHPALHVAIAGRGDQETPLREQARCLGVDRRVHLLGLRADVGAILAAADVFVLPSLSEGLPLALLEAMWAGRPIVASNVGQIGVALSGGDAGRLVEPGSPAVLAATLDCVLSDGKYAARLGARAAHRAREHYDITTMVARYVDLYRQAISANHGARAVPRWWRLDRRLPAAGRAYARR